MIQSVGVDVVDLSRWERAVSGSMLDRVVLTPAERSRRAAGQACAFAVKEALIKTLASSVMLHDLAAIDTPLHGELKLTGSAARRAGQLGVRRGYCSTACGSDEVVAVVMLEGQGGDDG